MQFYLATIYRKMQKVKTKQILRQLYTKMQVSLYTRKDTVKKYLNFYSIYKNLRIIMFIE